MNYKFTSQPPENEGYNISERVEHTVYIPEGDKSNGVTIQIDTFQQRRPNKTIITSTLMPLTVDQYDACFSGSASRPKLNMIPITAMFEAEGFTDIQIS